MRDADRILNAAEIGVVMLLFVIGLELSPSRLRVMRKPVFGVRRPAGAADRAGAGRHWRCWPHLHWKTALVVGLGLALSSTAVGLQLLAERKELTSDYGRLAFAILLFQDLVAIPLLAAIPLLGGAKEPDADLDDGVPGGRRDRAGGVRRPLPVALRVPRGRAHAHAGGVHRHRLAGGAGHRRGSCSWRA